MIKLSKWKGQISVPVWCLISSDLSDISLQLCSWELVYISVMTLNYFNLSLGFFAVTVLSCSNSTPSSSFFTRWNNAIDKNLFWRHSPDSVVPCVMHSVQCTQKITSSARNRIYGCWHLSSILSVKPTVLLLAIFYARLIRCCTNCISSNETVPVQKSNRWNRAL